MSYQKFSSLSTALLVRKGQAAPSVVAGKIGPKGIERLSNRNFVQPQEKSKAPTQLGRKVPPAKRSERAKSTSIAGTKRRLVLTLSNQEFERVCIAAAKMDMTRQQLAYNALFSQLSTMALEKNDCPCIASDKE